MPRFTEAEKQKINQDILIKGKELFSQFGLRKTSIDEIVKACNIGKGTFYRFYNSKEELFFKILENEEYFREKIFNELIISNKEPKDIFKELLVKAFQYVDQNPFYARIIDKQDIDLLYRKLPKETIENHFNQDMKFVENIFTKWMKDGVLKENNPEMIAGILQMVFMLFTFKNEFGELFPKIFYKLIDYIVDGIFK